MPHPCPPLDSRRMQAVDLQLLADLFQHAKLDLGMAAVGGDHVAGQRIGGLVETLGQSFADQAEEGGEAVFFFKKIKDGAGDALDAVGVIGGEGGHVVDHAGDGDEFGGAHVLIRGRAGHHDGHEGILRGHRRGFGHRGSFRGCGRDY